MLEKGSHPLYTTDRNHSRGPYMGYNIPSLPPFILVSFPNPYFRRRTLISATQLCITARNYLSIGSCLFIVPLSPISFSILSAFVLLLFVLVAWIHIVLPRRYFFASPPAFFVIYLIFSSSWGVSVHLPRTHESCRPSRWLEKPSFVAIMYKISMPIRFRARQLEMME